MTKQILTHKKLTRRISSDTYNLLGVKLYWFLQKKKKLIKLKLAKVIILFQ